MFSNNIIVTGNISIGESATVVTGSVAVKFISDFTIVGGNAAQIIKYRDIEHYQNLKMQNKFA